MRNYVIEFADEDIGRARRCAAHKVRWNYNRGNVSPEEEFRRLLVGKLGEIAYVHFLRLNNKRIVGNDDMFEVWEDVYAADLQDFLTAGRQTIDIKTASRNFHHRITIPIEQFDNQPKDFYVGIRISESLGRARVIGSASHEYVQQHGTRRQVGDSPNYRYPSIDMELRQLHPIQGLLNLIEDIDIDECR